jgi:hypothetical protein
MRALFTVAPLALCLLPTAARAQSRATAAVADTFAVELGGLPQAAGKTFRSRMVRSTDASRAREAGTIVQVTQTTTLNDDGSPSVRVEERLTADARTMMFRSSWRRTELASGMRLMEASHTIEGSRIRQVLARQEGERPDTTYGTLAASGAPYASIQHLLQRAPLNASWRGTYDVFTTATPYHQTMIVDSTTLERTDGVGARWVIHSHADSASRTLIRLVATLDSATQDILRLEWTRTDGTHTLMTNTRFATRSTSSAAPMAPVGGAEQKVAGHYYLQGEREVGSELMLTADGRFQYMFAYGALDESGEGQWRVQDGNVVMQSDGAARKASVTLASSSGTATDSIVFVVEDSAGHILPNLTLDFSRAGKSRFTVQTTREGYTLNFRRGMPPSEIGIGITMLEFRVGFPLTGAVHAKYRFIFDPGDLGTRRFEAERLRIEDGALIMTRNDHPMRYVRH